MVWQNRLLLNRLNEESQTPLLFYDSLFYWSLVMKEIWKDIPGYEGRYQISNCGQVKSLKAWNGRYQIYSKREKILKSSKTKAGYLLIRLSLDNKGSTYLIHRLVAQAFVLNPLVKPCVNHKDGNKLNNYWWNLNWCTYSENEKHAYRIGLKTRKGEYNTMAKLKTKQIKEIRKLKGKMSQRDIGKIYGVNQSCISDIINKKLWGHV